MGGCISLVDAVRSRWTLPSPEGRATAFERAIGRQADRVRNGGPAFSSPAGYADIPRETRKRGAAVLRCAPAAVASLKRCRPDPPAVW